MASRIALSFIGGFAFDSGRESFLLIWACAGTALLGAHNLLDSRSGRAIRALRFRSVMAESCGVDTGRLKLVVFVYAALLAGVSGWLHAHYLRFVSPHAFGVNAGIDYLFMAIIGGASEVWGAVVGSAVMTILKEWLSDLLPALFGHSGNYETIVFGVLMLVLLQHARGGLMPVISRFMPDAPTAPLADAPALERRSRAAAGPLLLEVNGLTKHFGGPTSVNDIGFSVRAGRILGRIRPHSAARVTPCPSHRASHPTHARAFNLVTPHPRTRVQPGNTPPAPHHDCLTCGQRAYQILARRAIVV